MAGDKHGTDAMSQGWANAKDLPALILPTRAG